MNFNAPGAGQFKTGTHLRHYKGGLYIVVGTCLIEATLKPGILYQPQQGGGRQPLVDDGLRHSMARAQPGRKA